MMPKAMVSVALAFKDVKEVKKRKKKESQAKKAGRAERKSMASVACLTRLVIGPQRIIRDCHELPFASYFSLGWI
jgi:hypothetical protein